MKAFLSLAALLLLLTGCEKQIELDLDDKSGDIVIEGAVTDGPGPYYVRLTQSVAFTANNQYPGIPDATVTISDGGGRADTLQYVGDGQYRTTHLSGTPGHTYRLQVRRGSMSYSAESTLPQRVPLDSLVQRSLSFGGETRYNLLPVFRDPATLGNRYLFLLSVNGSRKKTIETFSDNINNGLVNQRTLVLPNEEDAPVKIGDTIHVEMRGIDGAVYSYFTGVNQIAGDGGGGVTPANPPSNISNGALGYFSAHTSATTFKVIK